MTKYTARARRGDGWWAVTVDEVAGLITQARRLDQIPAMVRDALGLFPELETEPHNAEVVVIPEGVPAIVTDAREITAQSKLLQEQASGAMRRAARELSASGLTYRDIGAILDVSFQRAQKLATA